MREKYPRTKEHKKGKKRIQITKNTQKYKKESMTEKIPKLKNIRKENRRIQITKNTKKN